MGTAAGSGDEHPRLFGDEVEAEADEGGEEVVEAAELAAALEGKALLLVAAITPERVAGASLAQVATALGKLIDKAHLLRRREGASGAEASSVIVEIPANDR
jgi:hypothetical protein